MTVGEIMAFFDFKTKKELAGYYKFSYTAVRKWGDFPPLQYQVFFAKKSQYFLYIHIK